MNVVEKRGVEKMIVEKRDIVITMTSAEFEIFKYARGMLSEIYYKTSDGNIEKRAKECAAFMQDLMWKIKIDE